SVECGKNDKVIVDFGSYPDRDSVIFKDKYGVKLKVVDGNILSFTGVSQPDTNYIYAYRGDKKIGKLFLNTYKPQTKYIELVSVNRAIIDKSITAEGLNKIFKGAVVNFKIETKSLDIQGLQTFTHGGSNWHSVYNDDQKKVIEAYDKEMKDGVYYLFFIDDVRDKKDSLGTSVSGYMPRGYNAGFIYDRGSLHTVAHELGHGIGNLEHAFANSSSSGSTKNLMDYSSGDELWHFQWDQIQDPNRVWMKWNKDEGEGELIQRLAIDKYFNVKQQGWENCAFLSPNGAPIIIPGVTHVLFNEDGALLNYIIDGTKYYGVISRETQTFYGYVAEKNTNLIKNYVLTVERNDILSDILYKEVKFASNGVSVVSVYKEMYSDKYLDCVNLATWKNAQVYSTYLGRANSGGIPTQASITHLSGKGCVDLSNPDLIGGKGTDIYINLEKKIDGSKKGELVEFCNYFSEITQGKRFAFYNEELKDELQAGAFKQATIRYFIDNNIYSKAIFEKHFPTKFKCRDFDIVFSSVDLWDGIVTDYNSKSRSYHFNPGGKYIYSFDDLKKRAIYKSAQSVMLVAIGEFESKGEAQPISMKDGYKEYVAKWGTNSAFMAWAEFMSGSYEDLVKAYTMYYLAGALTSEMLLKYVGGEVRNGMVKRFVVGFSQSLITDVGMEYLLYTFFDENTESYKIEDVDEKVLDAIASGFQNAMNFSRGADVAIDIISSLDLVKLLTLTKKFFIEHQPFADEDYNLLSQQLFNMALAAGTSGALKGLDKVFQKCKPIFQKKFKGDKQKAVKYLVEDKHMDESTAKKLVEQVDNSPEPSSVNFANQQEADAYSVAQRSGDSPEPNKVNDANNGKPEAGTEPKPENKTKQDPENKKEPEPETNTEQKPDNQNKVDNTPARPIAELPDGIKKQYPSPADQQKFVDKPEMVEAWEELNELLRQYPKDYESIIKTEMKIESLTKYADDPSNVSKLKNILEMSKADMNPDWLDNMEICSKFFSDQKYWDTWNKLKGWQKEYANGQLSFPDDVFDDFDKFEKVKIFGTEKFIKAIQSMREKGMPEEWIKHSDAVLKIFGNNELNNTWETIRRSLAAHKPGTETKYPDFETFEILSTIDKSGKYSFNNMYKTFTADMADDICHIIKTQGKESMDWNVLLGNFDEVITFKDIKDKTGLLKYLNKSSNYYNKITKFAASKPKLREKLIKELEGTLQEKVKDFGEAFAQEYIGYILIHWLDKVVEHSVNGTDFDSYKYLCKIVSKQDIYQSAFRNALNSLNSNSSQDKITVSGTLNDFLTGINYTDLFSDKEDNIRRVVVQGLFNVIKNLLLRKINPKTFLGTLGYQIGFDGAEFYLEKMLESIGYLIKEYNE
ncbi:MAG: hypothetical protein PUC50_09570, partial [Bacteroidales bacterium]|nr:hypothetical protein [Bacteroidales bacterium]